MSKLIKLTGFGLIFLLTGAGCFNAVKNSFPEPLSVPKEEIKKEEIKIEEKIPVPDEIKPEKKPITENLPKKEPEVIIKPEVRTEPMIIKSRNRVDSLEQMVLIPEGEFIMGSNTGKMEEGPARKVFLKSFYIDKFEVTNDQYQEFVKLFQYKSEGEVQEMYTAQNGNHPVVMVSWTDARSFCTWAGKRLPSESEWEKAARGTDQRIFPWGNDFNSENANITGEDDYAETAPVGSFPMDKSSYGILDMAGNVKEWMEDWYQPYPGTKSNDQYFGEKFRVIRGGSWDFYTPDSVMVISRGGSYPKTSLPSLGFRCAID